MLSHINATLETIHILRQHNFWAFLHCKPKPCKAYRELPVSQFSQGKPCFHYREPCSHCRDPVFITEISLGNPVLPCMGLQCCQVFSPITKPLENVKNKIHILPRHYLKALIMTRLKTGVPFLAAKQQQSVPFHGWFVHNNKKKEFCMYLQIYECVWNFFN